MRVAETILEQLGGNKFAAMTGSKHFFAGDDFLGMKLIRNKSKANYLKITLTPADLYEMTFIKTTSRSVKTVLQFDSVYFDQLQEMFTSVTGLYTHL